MISCWLFIHTYRQQRAERDETNRKKILQDRKQAQIAQNEDRKARMAQVWSNSDNNSSSRFEKKNEQPENSIGKSLTRESASNIKLKSAVDKTRLTTANGADGAGETILKSEKILDDTNTDDADDTDDIVTPPRRAARPEDWQGCRGCRG